MDISCPPNILRQVDNNVFDESDLLYRIGKRLEGKSKLLERETNPKAGTEAAFADDIHPAGRYVARHVRTSSLLGCRPS